MNDILTSKVTDIVIGALMLATSTVANSENSLSDSTLEITTEEAHSFEAYSEIVEALQPYIISAKTGDGNLNSTAFYDHAHIVGSIGSEFYNLNVETFGNSVSAGGESPDIQHHIAWIDVSGPAAAAKVEFFNWGGHRFTDFFVLYKHDEQWKISGKVYDSHSKS